MNTSKYCTQNTTIKSALKTIDEAFRKVLFIVDDSNVLKGALTDGDVRRWILKNGSLDESIYKIMNASPVFVYENERASAVNLMKRKQVDAVPVLNNEKQVVDILFMHDFINDGKPIEKSPLDAKVIINAGGEGARLNPVTLVIPKPLVPVGGVTILERIIERFREYHISELTVIINYKKELIKAYFSEIKADYKINFIDETKPLGTIGGLSRLEASPDKSVFFSNCDILIEADYNDILSFHKESGNKITVVASVKNTRLQYGVIDVDKTGRVTEIREKPEYDFLANTGLYVLEPEVLRDIPQNEFYHATDLINNSIKGGSKVGVYPVGEDCWLDMGQFGELGVMAERLERTGKS